MMLRPAQTDQVINICLTTFGLPSLVVFNTNATNHARRIARTIKTKLALAGFFRPARMRGVLAKTPSIYPISKNFSFLLNRPTKILRDQDRSRAFPKVCSATKRIEKNVHSTFRTSAYSARYTRVPLKSPVSGIAKLGPLTPSTTMCRWVPGSQTKISPTRS